MKKKESVDAGVVSMQMHLLSVCLFVFDQVLVVFVDFHKFLVNFLLFGKAMPLSFCARECVGWLEVKKPESFFFFFNFYHENGLLADVKIATRMDFFLLNKIGFDKS